MACSGGGGGGFCCVDSTHDWTLGLTALDVRRLGWLEVLRVSDLFLDESTRKRESVIRIAMGKWALIGGFGGCDITSCGQSKSVKREVRWTTVTS